MDHKTGILLAILGVVACGAGRSSERTETGAPPAEARAATRQRRGPSTPEERASAVSLARRLEADPLAAELKDERARVMAWLIEVPDISVTLCADLTPDTADRPYPFMPELVAQQTLSQAAFVIEHPKQASDKVGQQLAGLQSTLGAYQAILRTHPDAKHPHFEHLLEQMRAGTLRQAVEQLQPKCRQ